MEKKTTTEELKTVQQEWMGDTRAQKGIQEPEVVVRECSCSFD
jgi:hypothetical protein